MSSMSCGRSSRQLRPRPRGRPGVRPGGQRSWAVPA
jgi:hypothetical protein